KDGDREEDAVQALADLEQGGPPPAGTPPHREPAAGAHGSAGRRTPRGRLQASGGSYLAMNNAAIPRMPGFSLGDERSSAGGASRAQEKGDEGGGVSQQQQQRDESAAPAGGGTSVRPRGAPPGSRSGSRSGTHAKAGGDGSAQISDNTGKGGGKGKGKAKRRGVQTASGPPVEPATPPTAKQQQSGKANKRTRASAEDDEDAEEEDSTDRPKRSKKTASPQGDKTSEDHRPSGSKPKENKKSKSTKARQQQKEGSADSSKSKGKNKKKKKKTRQPAADGEDSDGNDPGKDYSYREAKSRNLWRETIFKPVAEELKKHAKYVEKYGTARIHELFLTEFGMKKGVEWYRSQRKQAGVYVRDHGQSGASGGKEEKQGVRMRQDLYSNHPGVTKEGMRESSGGFGSDSDDGDDDDDDDDEGEREGDEGGEGEVPEIDKELWGDIGKHLVDQNDGAANLTMLEEGDDCSARDEEPEAEPPGDYGDPGGDWDGDEDGDGRAEGNGSTEQQGRAGGVLPPPAARAPADQPLRRRPVGSGGGSSTDGTPRTVGSGGGRSSRGAPSRTNARPRHVARGTHGALDEDEDIGTSGLPPGPTAKGKRKSGWNPPGVSVEEYMGNTSNLGQQRLAIMEKLVAQQAGGGG
ncbi:unnamed protein product, partial [Ectocarpus fasciculatus]